MAWDLAGETGDEDMRALGRKLRSLAGELVPALRKLKSPEPKHVRATLRALGEWRDRLEDGLLHVGPRTRGEPIWGDAGQQLVEHHAQRVHVGCRRDGLAADLLGCRVLGREDGQAAGERLVGRRPPASFAPPAARCWSRKPRRTRATTSPL